MITSPDNGRIKHLAELQNRSRLRVTEGMFVSEGFKLFAEAPDQFIKEIYLRTDVRGALTESYEKAPFSFRGEVWSKIERLREMGIPVEEVSERVFDKVSQTDTPQGILVLLRMPSYALEDLMPGEGKKGTLLILEDIRDPGNLGTMMRTAEGAGVCGVLMSKGTVDLFNPKTVRATMGSLYRVPFRYEEDLGETVRGLKEKGFRICAAHLEGSVPYDRADYGRCTGIMIGNEANGLSDALTAEADIRVRIPMEGQLESLNASVAAALLMYEARKE